MTPMGHRSAPTRDRTRGPAIAPPRGARPEGRPDPLAARPGGLLVAVTGASGGLGASVVVAALSVRAVAAGLTVCAVDLDPLGGGLDVVLGLEQTPGTRWGELASLEGDADGRVLLPTLPRAEGVAVLSHDRHGGEVAPAVVGAVVAALVGVCDLVVLDLPRWCRPPHEAPPVGRHLLLCGTGLAQVTALSALLASSGASSGRGVLLRPGPAAGTSRGRGVGGLGGLGDLADLVEEQLGVPVLGVVPDDRTVRADLAHGLPPGRGQGPLVRALDPVLAELVHGPRAGVA